MTLHSPHRFGWFRAEREALRDLRYLCRPRSDGYVRKPRQIAEAMNELGHRTRAGTPWTAARVRWLLGRHFAGA